MEKDVVKKKRFSVFELAKLSDLESKFNSEALGSIAHCEPGLQNKSSGTASQRDNIQQLFDGY